jgi:DNA-binding MarR family transcriptional regulator
MAEFLKPYALSGTQYNVLRILRGAGADGTTCSQLGERMISRDPDISRLLDRMEARRLIIRERSKEDRRVVLTRISQEGLDLVNNIDAPVRELLKATLGRLKKHKLEELIDSLEQVREVLE